MGVVAVSRRSGRRHQKAVHLSRNTASSSAPIPLEQCHRHSKVLNQNSTALSARLLARLSRPYSLLRYSFDTRLLSVTLKLSSPRVCQMPSHQVVVSSETFSALRAAFLTANSDRQHLERSVSSLGVYLEKWCDQSPAQCARDFIKISTRRRGRVNF